jgi:serine/threonine-protein kinase
VIGTGGDTVARRYQLVEPLGRGGGGEVWRARDLRLGIDVALKLARDNGGAEAELSARMLSRNVVRVLDRGTDERGAPFIVFELLEGCELGARLGEDAMLSFADTAAVIVQVCRALERVHAVGVVHRDVKPQNIFLCREDGMPLVKLIDFGIARLGTACSPLALDGTPQYISPEVLLDGKAPDARSDLWALAAVAYRCFTGRVPHPGATIGQVLLSHDAGPPAAPSVLRVAQEELIDPLDRWFAIALHRDPAFRYQSARDMAAAFVDLNRRTRSSDRVRASETRPSFPSLSDVDLSEKTLPPRITSGYRIVTERPPGAWGGSAERKRRAEPQRGTAGKRK